MSAAVAMLPGMKDWLFFWLFGFSALNKMLTLTWWEGEHHVASRSLSTKTWRI